MFAWGVERGHGSAKPPPLKESKLIHPLGHLRLQLHPQRLRQPFNPRSQKVQCKECNMVICPKCNIEHDAGKKFCRKCGSFLLTEEEAPAGLEGWGPIGGVRTKAKLICPKCQALYEIGNYCRRCGSLLVQLIISQGVDVRPFQ